MNAARQYRPAFDTPTTPEEALAWLTKQGEPGVMTFAHEKAARAAQLLADALDHRGGQAMLSAVLAELARAVDKFPTWPTDPLHAIAVLGEEFGELTKAVLQSVYEPHKVQAGDVRSEAIQTAAMALRFLMSLDRYRFLPSDHHPHPTPTLKAESCGYPNCNCPFDHPGTAGWCARGLSARSSA